MNNYHESYQCLIDYLRCRIGKGNWKITPYSKEWAILEYYQNGKWIKQGSYPMSLIK